MDDKEYKITKDGWETFLEALERSARRRERFKPVDARDCPRAVRRIGTVGAAQVLALRFQQDIDDLFDLSIGSRELRDEIRDDMMDAYDRYMTEVLIPATEAVEDEYLRATEGSE